MGSLITLPHREYADVLEKESKRSNIPDGWDEVLRAAYTSIRTLSDIIDTHLADKAGVRVDGWLPIESAPKDGTHILLCCGSRVTVGDYVSPEMHPEWDGDDFEAHWQNWDGGFLAEGDYAATHWMPLPPGLTA